MTFSVCIKPHRYKRDTSEKHWLVASVDLILFADWPIAVNVPY